jgi:hypothetical protein
MEKIEPPPPPIPLTDEERGRLKMEAIESEDLWVKNFINALAGNQIEHRRWSRRLGPQSSPPRHSELNVPD